MPTLGEISKNSKKVITVGGIKKFFTSEDYEKILWLITQSKKSKFVKSTDVWKHTKATCTFSFPGKRVTIISSHYKEEELDKPTVKPTMHSGTLKIFTRQGSGGYGKVHDSSINRLSNFEKTINDFAPQKKDPNYKPKELESREFTEPSTKEEVVLTVIEDGHFNIYYIVDGDVKKDSYRNKNLDHIARRHYEPSPHARVAAVASRDDKRLYEGKNSDPGAEPFFIINTWDHTIAVSTDVDIYWEVTQVHNTSEHREFNLIKDSQKNRLNTNVRDMVKIMIYRYMEEL